MTIPHYLSLVDTETDGPRYDVTPLFADHAAFVALLDDLVAPFAETQIDLVAGIDALGFILGTAVALRLGVGFVPIRKGGKLPGTTLQQSFVYYSSETKTLELRRDAIQPQSRVLLVDEWIETGAQARDAAALIEASGGIVAGIATINIDTNERTQQLRSRYVCHAVWHNYGN